MIRISRRARRYSFSSRIASVWSSSSSKRAMIFCGRVRLALGLADDADDLVEDVEDLLEPSRMWIRFSQRGQFVFEPPGHDIQAEVQEVPQDGLEVQPLRPADLRVLRRDQARQVDREGGLQRRVLRQVRHHHLLVGVLLHLQLDPHVVGRHVAHVEQRRQLAAQHHVGDPLDQLRLVHHVRDAGDDDRAAAAARRALFPRAARRGRTPNPCGRSPAARRPS